MENDTVVVPSLEKVNIVMHQTNYTEETAREKLKVFHNDEIAVIRDYLGLPEKAKKEEPIQSVNQAIYKQLRYKLDANMRDYTARVGSKTNAV